MRVQMLGSSIKKNGNRRFSRKLWIVYHTRRAALLWGFSLRVGRIEIIRRHITGENCCLIGIYFNGSCLLRKGMLVLVARVVCWLSTPTSQPAEKSFSLLLFILFYVHKSVLRTPRLVILASSLYYCIFASSNNERKNQSELSSLWTTFMLLHVDTIHSHTKKLLQVMAHRARSCKKNLTLTFDPE